jgi:carbon monoxide dehydrogenase subunit G
VILDQAIIVPLPPEPIWTFMMDVPAMGRCVPGVESIQAQDDDTFLGVLKVRVGPIAVRLEGRVTVTERNADEWRAKMQVDAADRKINGAVNAKAVLQLRPLDHGRTEIGIRTDAAVLGKLGEFGQSIVRRKADQILVEFVDTMARTIASKQPSANPTADPVP